MLLEHSYKKADKTTAAGVIQMLAGGLLILLFGIVAIFGRIWSLFSDSASSLPTQLFLISIVIGAFIIWKGYRNYKLSSRFRRIHRIMGESTYIELTEIEQKLYWNRRKLLKVLHRQASHGLWPESFIDDANGVFVLGYSPAHRSINSGNMALDEVINAANERIHDMATINRTIEDKDLRTQVDVLIDIARQIYNYAAKNPEKTGQLRQMSNYLLPTTVKLLTDYAQLHNQPVKSENMLESMQKIKDMMNTIEAAYRKHLSDLYENKSMDIQTEIEVMKKIIDTM